MPLVGIVLTLWLVVVVYGYAGISLVAGQALIRRNSGLGVWVAAAALLTMICLIPVAGFLAMIVICVAGPGSVLAAGLGADPDWLSGCLGRRKRDAIEPGP